MSLVTVRLLQMVKVPCSYWDVTCNCTSSFTVLYIHRNHKLGLLVTGEEWNREWEPRPASLFTQFLSSVCIKCLTFVNILKVNFSTLHVRTQNPGVFRKASTCFGSFQKQVFAGLIWVFNEDICQHGELTSPLILWTAGISHFQKFASEKVFVFFNCLLDQRVLDRLSDIIFVC